MSIPITSVIIATRNRAHLLMRAIESARAAGREIETIVVDDASSDATSKLCRSLTGIKYTRLERNLGLGGARNVGLVFSRGKYVTFLDDDDVRLPASIDKQVELLEREPQAMLAYGQAIPEDETAKQHPPYPSDCHEGDVFWKLLERNFIPCGSVVFRRAAVTSVGLLEESLGGIEDWDLWVRIAEIYPVVVVPSPVLVWCRSSPVSGQLSSATRKMAAQSIRQFRCAWMNLPRALAASQSTRRATWRAFSRSIAEHLLWQSVRSLRHGNLRQPFANVPQLLRLHPLTLALIARERTKSIVAKNYSRFEASTGAGQSLEKLN